MLFFHDKHCTLHHTASLGLLISRVDIDALPDKADQHLCERRLRRTKACSMSWVMREATFLQPPLSSSGVLVVGYTQQCSHSNVSCKSSGSYHTDFGFPVLCCQMILDEFCLKHHGTALPLHVGST